MLCWYRVYSHHVAETWIMKGNNFQHLRQVSTGQYAESALERQNQQQNNCRPDDTSTPKRGRGRLQ